MTNTSARQRLHQYAGLIALVLTGCQAPDAPNNSTATHTKTPAHATPQVNEAAVAAPSGPEMLTTVGLYADGKTPLTVVHARQAEFAIRNIGGTDTLTVNGQPAQYRSDGTDQPVPVTANDSLSLVGVFELPTESVAWVIVIGGTACPGSHILVGARDGKALPGQELPGCDDQGTMRRTGDKITFDAGGATGTYQNGMISVESKPAYMQQPVTQ